MANEEFKISLGVELDDSSVRTELNDLKNDINKTPIKLKIDTDSVKSKLNTVEKQIKGLIKPDTIKLAIDTASVKKKLNTVEKQIKGLNDIKIDTGSKSGNKNVFPVSSADLNKITDSFRKLDNFIDEIKISFGSLGKDTNMKPLLTSINEISNALSEVSKQFNELSKSFTGFNFNVNLGGSKNPFAANAAYGSKARKDTIPELDAQTKYLENLLGGREKIFLQLVKYMKQFDNVDMLTKYPQMLERMAGGDGVSLAKQMDAYREYIDYMKKLAKIDNVDIGEFNSKFSKSADELIDTTKKIQTGEENAEESMQRLQKIFGGSNIDAEGLTTQLDSIVRKLTEIGEAVIKLSSGISVDGLTESFNKLSSSIEQISVALGSVSKQSKSLNIDMPSVESAGSSIADKIEKASDDSTSTVIQNEKKKQETIRQTQQLISDSAQQSIDSISSKGINKYFEIDKSNSDAFEKEMDSLVKQWTNNKGNLVDLKIDTKTYYDEEKQANVKRLHQAQVTYNNELGETIKKTIAWRKISVDDNNNPVHGFAEVTSKYSKSIGETSSKADNFVKQQKQAVSNLTNQINQLNRAANDQNASRPIKDSGHLGDISSKYNEIISAIQRMGNASSDTFVDEQNNVKKLISEYKSLISEYRNAENISSKMKGTDFASGLEIAKNDLKKFKSDAKDFPQITKTINELDEAIKTVGDTSSLNEFNDQLRVARTELAKIKSETSATNRKEKVGINVSGLESKIADLQRISPEIDKFETEINGAKVSVQSLLNDLKQVNTQGDFTVVNSRFKAFADAAKASGIAITETTSKTEDAYNELINKIKEIGSIQIKLTGLDAEKDANEIKALKDRLVELNVEYDKLDSTFSQNFNTNQVNSLNEAWDQVVNKINVVDAKLADTTAFKQLQAEAKQVAAEVGKLFDVANKIDKLEIDIAKLDEDSNADEITELRNQLDRANESYRELITSLRGKLSTEQLEKLGIKASETQDKISRIKAQMSDKSRSKQQKEATQQTAKEIDNLLNAAKQMESLELEIGKLKISDGKENEIEALEATLKSVREEYEKLIASFNFNDPNLNIDDFAKLNAIFEKTQSKLAQFEGKAKDVKAKLVRKIIESVKVVDLDATVSDINKKISSITDRSYDLDEATDDFSDSIRLLNVAIEDSDIDFIIDAWNNYEEALKRVNNQLKINKNEQDQVNAAQKQDRADQKLDIKKDALAGDMDVWLKKNSAASKEFGAQIVELKRQLLTCDDAFEYEKILAAFKAIQREAKLTGKDTLSFGDKLKKQFEQYSSYLSIASLINYAEQALRSMYNNVVEVDTAMTNLYKVTDETANRYDQFLSSASKNAQELGRSMSGYIEQTANWSKMGFDLDESEELAKISSIYANVADVDDATAVSDMVTAMKAFNIEAENAITVLDPINKLSNEFAVTAAGLGQGLSRAASTMSTSGTDLEHTLALLTGISEITQSPEEAGNFLKTAVARIQGKLSCPSIVKTIVHIPCKIICGKTTI